MGAVLSAALAAGGCSTSQGPHILGPSGASMPQMEYLWNMVNDYFPGALPRKVHLVQIQGPHASFMIDTDSIGIPEGLKNNVRRGKVCRELTHLALHHLSGGDEEKPGRCFDNDVVFLEQAVAGFMDRKAAELLDKELAEVNPLAAKKFRDGSLSIHDLRDWESFFYRGYWSDQYKEWNLEGLRIMTSFGEYLDRTYGLSALGPVFKDLGRGSTLNEAMKKHLGRTVEEILLDWRRELLDRVPEKAVPKDQDEEKGTPPDLPTPGPLEKKPASPK